MAEHSKALTLGGAAARGALVGASVVGGVLGVLAFGTSQAKEAEGLDGLGTFLFTLHLIPAVAIVVGVVVAMALRLPWGWLIGLVGPFVALVVGIVASQPGAALVAEVVMVYAALATASTAFSGLGASARGTSSSGRSDRPRRSAGGGKRSLIAVLAIADAVLLVAAIGVVATVVDCGQATEEADVSVDLPPSPAATALPGRLVTLQEVGARPRPSPATPTGPWSATLAAKGDRVELGLPGRVVGGIRHVSIGFVSVTDLPRGDASSDFLLPDGSRWTPDGTILLEGPGDLPFVEATVRPGSMTVLTTLDAVVAAPGGVTAVGRLVSSDGRKVDRLVLPAGTRRDSCRRSSGVVCGDYKPSPLQVRVKQVPGMRIQAAGDGEFSVTGTATVTAAGRSWEGLVAAVDAKRLRLAATFADGAWSVTAEGAQARQVWMDVWPVIDTELSAKAVLAGKPSLLHPFRSRRQLPLRITWKNVGFATSQILGADGQGTGAMSVGFRMATASGHDAGLGVTRRPEVRNLKGGLDIPSELEVGDSIERGLSFEPGGEASIVLRGNFPTVTVPLPTGGS